MKSVLISIASVIPAAFACVLIHSFPASAAVSGGGTSTGQPTGGDPVMGGVAAYEPPDVGGPGRTTGSGTRQFAHRGSGRVNPPTAGGPSKAVKRTQVSHRGSGRLDPKKPA